MDQFTSMFGKEGYMIKLNCNTLEYEYEPFAFNGYRVVLVDSKVKHALVGSPYNRRRESCERVVAALSQRFPEVSVLADAKLEMLDEIKMAVDERDYKRAKYVIEENMRLMEACEALKHGDIERVGLLMYATHKGLREQYEVSTPELDYLNRIAMRCGVAGSRIMGGGFGGCTINIVKNDRYDHFIEEVFKQYEAKFAITPAVYDVKIGNGAHKLD